jgi:hypothetical protein
LQQYTIKRSILSAGRHDPTRHGLRRLHSANFLSQKHVWISAGFSVQSAYGNQAHRLGVLINKPFAIFE